MRKVLKSVLAILFVSLLSAQLFAVDGTVTYVKGKVEVKRGDSWVSLRVGDKVAQSETINTGFQSEAKVKLMDSVLYLGPVTRVTLDQLASSSDKDKVNVYLSAGTVRSKVNRTDNKKVSYTVRTPIAVASVRGTDLATDASGNLFTIEGFVAYSTTQDLGIPLDKLRNYDEEASNGGDSESDKKDAKGGRVKTDSELAMENSDGLPNKLIVSKNKGINHNDAMKFGNASPSVASNAMNILQAVAPETTKSSVSQGSQSQSVSSTINSSIPGTAVAQPKTGSIKVQIEEPTTGNVSVEVQLPQ